MDAAHMAVAFLPLSAYLLRQALLNMSRQPHVVSGFRDAGYLVLGICGCVLAGPFELFFPESASYLFGPLTWVLLLGLYLLGSALVIMLLRPRLVLYNAERNRVLPLLRSWFHELDPQSTWAGDHVVCPQLRVQLHLEYHPLTRNLQLVSTGALQDFEGWARIEKKLRLELRNVAVPRNGTGIALFAISIVLLGYVSVAVLSSGAQTVALFREMLRIYQ